MIHGWQQYRQSVLRRCGVHDEARKDIHYWRSKLFAENLVVLFPLCFIAVVPGMLYAMYKGSVVVTVLDMIVLITMGMATLMENLSLRWRKIIFLGTTYLASIILLAFIGLQGPGQIYLLASSIFGLLFTNSKYRFGYPILNTVILLGVTLAIHFGYSTPANPEQATATAWLVVVSNTIFLSFLFAVLLSRLVDQLDKRYQAQAQLSQKLSDERNNLQKALNKLEAKSADMEQFAYFASHDLREPLRMVTAFMQQLKTKYSHQLDEKANTYIHFATDGARRMEQLIDDLLQYSRTGRSIHERELVPVNDVITEVMILLRSAIQESGAQMSIEPMPVTHASKTELRLLFQNLISNAIKYQLPGQVPQIHISARQDGPNWLFSVTDNGIGIAAENQDRIFQLFQRLQSRQQYPGSGIGLAICKKIIDMMHGRIWVESVEGEGACFKFTIPAETN